MREIDAIDLPKPPSPDPPREESAAEECLRLRHELEERGEFSDTTNYLGIAAFNWGRSDAMRERDDFWLKQLRYARARAGTFLILGLVLGLILMAVLLR